MRLLALAALLSLVSAQEIGANFNHNPENLDLGDLKRVPVRWVRTTPYIFEYIRGEKDPETSQGLTNILAAKRAGYKVAFGFRWDFARYKLRIPEPDTPAEREYFAMATRILDRVGPAVDMFKLGNEPALETLDADMRPGADGVIPLVRFTGRLLTECVEPYYRKHPELRRPPVYVGSLQALFEPRMQTLPAVPALIQLAQQNPAVAGLSIHLHIASASDIDAAFRFVRERMPDKPIIVPEFSLHQLYRKHLGDSLGDSSAGVEFATAYKRDPKMKLHHWYSLANQHQVSPAEWQAMFESRSWFPRHFLQTFYDRFNRNGVVLATYGFVSQYAPRTVPPDGSAWFVNVIFPFKSLPSGADGMKPPNPLWFDDFVDIVNRGNKRKSSDQP